MCGLAAASQGRSSSSEDNLLGFFPEHKGFLCFFFLSVCLGRQGFGSGVGLCEPMCAHGDNEPRRNLEFLYVIAPYLWACACVFLLLVGPLEVLAV